MIKQSFEITTSKKNKNNAFFNSIFVHSMLGRFNYSLEKIMLTSRKSMIKIFEKDLNEKTMVDLLLSDVKSASNINFSNLVHLDLLRFYGYFKIKFLLAQLFCDHNVIDVCLKRLLEEIDFEELEKEKNINKIEFNINVILTLLKMYLFSIETSIPETLL